MVVLLIIFFILAVIECFISRKSKIFGMIMPLLAFGYFLYECIKNSKATIFMFMDVISSFIFFVIFTLIWFCTILMQRGKSI